MTSDAKRGITIIEVSNKHCSITIEAAECLSILYSIPVAMHIPNYCKTYDTGTIVCRQQTKGLTQGLA